MKKKSGVSMVVLVRVLAAGAFVSLAGCAGSSSDNAVAMGDMSTPTVDYVEQLDVYSAPHKDSFLNQLAMNYRSYAIYNARTSGYGDMGELFAQKAVAAFSGELPFPESLDNWPVDDEQVSFELYTARNELMDELKDDASDKYPELAAEVQAKFDCWLSATASGQTSTARQCRDRYGKAMNTLRDCRNGKIVNLQVKKRSLDVASKTASEIAADAQASRGTAGKYYSDTRTLPSVRGSSQARDGVIIVNNVNVPEHLINPVPVQPMVFNQNIYGGDKTVSKNANVSNNGNDSSFRASWNSSSKNSVVANNGNDNSSSCTVNEFGQTQCQQESDMQQAQPEQIPQLADQYVSRDEFINMMMAMRAELAAINQRLDKIQAASSEKTMIKVQQIPLEPKQHVMEEVFEIRFDFNKAVIKPEYEDLIRKLVTATQENKNIKVSVIGHTDTMGSSNYNYALGGRRADAVQKMLIKYGIPASQIVAVSAGEEDLAVPTPDGVPNAENRRVQVIKEIHYTEMEEGAPITVEVSEGADESCGMYGCGQ